MSKPNPYTDNSIMADIRRLVRLHPREELDQVILEYIKENFIPAISMEKRNNLRASKGAIIAAVCSYFNMTMDDLRTKTRKKSVCFPRQVLQFMLAAKTELSLEDVGDIFGLHYSTVIASRNKLMAQYKANASVRLHIDSINQMLPRQKGKELYDKSVPETETAVADRPKAEYSNHSPWQIAG